MDHQRDYLNFAKLVGRLCETLSKPVTNELVESWWKSLRNVDYRQVEIRIDAFIARAGEKTPFPRPGQMRPEDAPVPGSEDGRDWKRDYWRTVIVSELERALMAANRIAAPADAEAYLVAHKQDLAGPLRFLLDDLSGRVQMTSEDATAAHLCAIDGTFSAVASHLAGLGLPTNRPPQGSRDTNGPKRVNELLAKLGRRLGVSA